MTILNLILPILALAASPDLRLPEASRFTYGGEFEVVQKRMVEGVQVDSQAGLDRMEELRREGYICTLAGTNLARCVGFVSVDGAEAEVKARVDSLLEGTVLEFSAREGEPSLRAKGDAYEEWSVPQAGSFRGKAFGSYRYQILRDGPHKLYFGEDGVAVNESGLSYVVSIHKNVKRMVTATYLVRAKLR